MHTYLPSVFGNSGVEGQSISYGMTPEAYEFAQLWLAVLKERAKSMVGDSRLVECAQDHACYLASRTGQSLLQSMHVGRNGTLSNERVLASGYDLPDEYRPHANNVESCARDAGGPQAALDGLLASPAHHDHLMGVNGFSDRVVWGVGQSGDDYVILACPEEASN